MVYIGWGWLVSGIVLGGLYALMSSGLTLMWGTVNVLNFSHGVFITWGGYIFWLFAVSVFNLNYVVAMAIAAAFTFFMGVTMELAVFRPIRKRPNAEMNSIYASMGLAICLEILILFVFGPRRRKIPPMIEGSLAFGEITITNHKLLIVIISVFTLIAFWIFIKKTTYGMAMRAVAQDKEAAEIMGINVNRVYLLTIGLGSALAGITGALLGSIYFLYYLIGDIPLIKGFIIITFGGLGSIKGTIFASFVLGILEALAAMVLGLGWALPFLFVFMMVTLIVKPTGLFGRKV